jgi:glucose-6-phosphate isomerase
MLEANLGAYEQGVEAAVEQLEAERVMERIWSRDHTVWKPDPAEIANRLGWLRVAEASKQDIPRLTGLADALRGAGYRRAVLLGMGGSSLAPEVFGSIFGPAEGYPELSVIDSTDPQLILSYAEELDFSATLFIVSTKSGSTVETLSFFKYFYNRTAEAVGGERAGEHFVAVTDPGSKLVDLADRYRFRETFLNDPDIGGRYSALSYFGLLPAALLGIDLGLLLERAIEAACDCGNPDCSGGGKSGGSCAFLGAILGKLASESDKKGGRGGSPGGRPRRDKLTIFASPGIESFGDWIEQLIAESTGKEGRGIVPVIGEPVGKPEAYGQDRLFVYLRLDGEGGLNGQLQALEEAGHPVVRIDLRDLHDLGAQFFVWEMATAVAGHLLGINPFNQPNVESAKARAREMMSAYTKTGDLPEDRSEPADPEVLKRFLDQSEERSYVSLQAYVQPAEETDALLQQLRTRIRNRYQVATTVGYGPRFLHSTGQLHKGDGGGGLFIQFTDTPRRDAPIPEVAGEEYSAASFGVLKMAQALGDKRALKDKQRRVIRIHLGSDVNGRLRTLLDGMGG